MATLEDLLPPSITTLDPTTLQAFILRKREDRRNRKEVKKQAKVKKAKQAKKPLDPSSLSSDQANKLLSTLEELLNDRTSNH